MTVGECGPFEYTFRWEQLVRELTSGVSSQIADAVQAFEDRDRELERYLAVCSQSPAAQSPFVANQDLTSGSSLFATLDSTATAAYVGGGCEFYTSLGSGGEPTAGTIYGITVPRTGIYALSAFATVSASAARTNTITDIGGLLGQIRAGGVNGGIAAYSHGLSILPPGSTYPVCQLTAVNVAWSHLEAGDIVCFEARQSSGETVGFADTADYNDLSGYLSVHYVREYTAPNPGAGGGGGGPL